MFFVLFLVFSTKLPQSFGKRANQTYEGVMKIINWHSNAEFISDFIAFMF